MKKLKLLFAAAALVGGVASGSAQTDVTSTYLTNADFATGTPIDNNVCTYGKDMEGNGTTYYGAQSIDGWTNASVGAEDSGYANSKLAGALFAYGSTPWLAGSGTPAPATDPNGNAGQAAGLCAVWGGSVQYTQDVTLPAGGYTIKFKVYNATSGSGNCSGVITKDLFGFKADAGTEYYAPNNTFAIGQWSTIAVTFILTEETAGNISMGYVGPSGNAAMPHLFVDNVKIFRNVMTKDFTDKVAKSGWTGAGDGYQGGAINTARQYGDKSVGRHIYQTVSGLDNGTYEVALYSISQKEWNGTLANDAGDVAYVFAGDGEYELKEWINARARAAYPGDDNIGIYTISGVQVTDGNLTLGMGLAQADLTEWHHVQIKSLVRTYIDLSDLVTGYNNALTAAKAVDQTQKMAESVKNALNTAIDSYDTGKVNTEDGDALQDATDALKAATALANTSIASYAIIEAGTVPDNSLAGWTCTNTNTFHINTWSSEGNSDGSNMKTPFIENWVGKGSFLGAGVVSYTLEGVEPGESYVVSALVRSYNEASSDAPNGPNFFINSVESNLVSEGTTFTYNGMSGIYATLTAEATVGEDGKITLGVKIAEDRNYNWVAFKNISIQSLNAAYAAAVKEITDQEGTIPTAAYNDLYKVVTDNSEVTTASIANIKGAVNRYAGLVELYTAWKEVKATANTLYGSNEALIALVTAQESAVEDATTADAITTPTNIVKGYNTTFNGWLDLKSQSETLVKVDNNNPTANTTLSAEIEEQATAVGTASTFNDVLSATTALKAAMTEYVKTAEPINDGCFDLTFLIANPHFTEGTAANPTGWTASWPDNPSGGWGGAHELRIATHNFEAYHKGFELSQTIADLPKGTYKVTLQGFARHDGDDKDKTNLFCGIVNQPIKNIKDEYSTTPIASGKPALGDTNGESSYTLGEQTVYQPNGMSASYYFFQETNPATGKPFYTNEVQTLITQAGDLKIGFKCETWSDWVIWDNFHLYYYGSAIAVTIDEDAASSSYTEDIENANVTLKRTFNADKWNTIALPFDLTEEETKTAFGDDAEVAVFSEVPDGTNSTVNFDTTTDGISANVPVLLKTSTTETTFTFNGVTIKAGEAKAEGTNFDFVGTYNASTIIAAGDYFIASNKLYKSSGTTTIKGTRAYIKAKDPEAGARISNFWIDGGDTTGIKTIENSPFTIENFYDLQGRKVAKPTKGLYIKNGKKVIVK